MWEPLLGALLIFGLRLCDVSLGTVRFMVSLQGRRLLAAVIAFFEVTIFVVAIGKVVDQLDQWWNVVGYASGFSVGTVVGIWLEGRLALGHRVVRIITHRQNDALVNALREDGFGVTRLAGEGMDGTVYILFSVVRRRNLDRFMARVKSLAPMAFVTVEEAKQTYHGQLPVVGRMK